MNYFNPYPFRVDDNVTNAWKEAANTPSLAEVIARGGGDLFPRFAACYAQLRVLPRGARRALQRKLAQSRETAAVLHEWLQQRAGHDLQPNLAHTLAGAALLLALAQGVAAAATITVTTNVPKINPDGKCSLIEAIVNANADAQIHPDCAAGDGADTIVLPAKSTHSITYANNSNHFNDRNGLPVITSQITIEGNGATIARKADAPEFRLINVSYSGDLTLQRVTLTGGLARSVYGGGGGILNAGTLTIENSKISGNTATDFPFSYDVTGGGGIYNSGALTITNSIISGNTANANVFGLFSDDHSARGGGIFNSGYLTIDNSTISGNTASVNGRGGYYYDTPPGASGGGIFNSGELTITNSTISGNTVGDNLDRPGYLLGNFKAGGGGVFNSYGTMYIGYSKIVNNTVSGSFLSSNHQGGGIYSRSYYGYVSLFSSVVSGNKAGSGGGIWSADYALDVSYSTVSGNTARFNGGGILAGSGYGYSGFTYLGYSTISGNSAGGNGGGVWNAYGSGSNLVYSTISGNSAARNGGGIFNRGGTFLANSTISGNASGEYGGGINNDSSGNLSLLHGTISKNTAGFAGGGIFNSSYLTLNNSLISGNVAAKRADEIVTTSYYAPSGSYNLFGANGSGGVNFVPGPTDIVPGAKVSKIIGKLKNNGGPTKTHALPKGSPAIDAIPSSDPSCGGTDQRGVARPRGAGCDIGAFER